MQKLWIRARVLMVIAAVLLAPACTRTSDANNAVTQRMADREQIEATLQRYLNGLDRLDAELYASSFTPDGEMLITGSRHRGRDEMRAIVAQERALRQSMKDRGEPPRTLFHLETNSRIEFPAPDRALHSAYWLTVSRTGEGPAGLSVIAVGSSTDELRKADGKWLISRREIRTEP
jgi:uncharacterized protein (TIGR02246 family)